MTEGKVYVTYLHRTWLLLVPDRLCKFLYMITVTCKKQSNSDSRDMYIVSAIKESQCLTDGIYHQIAISLLTTSHNLTDISLLFDMLSTHIIPVSLR